jgi:YspA, cpYpsA-related SLOG family
MKLIIAGSRTVDHGAAYDAIESALSDVDSPITEIVSGGARGVDRIGERWARKHGFTVKPFVPDWSQGKQAGIVRNIAMGKYADRLLAIWDGKSSGTKQMIDWMRMYGKPVQVITLATR